MFEGMDAGRMAMIAFPLVALQAGLDIFCLVKIFRQGTANLNKWLWAAIVVLINLFGAVAFLLLGRKKDI